MESREMRAALVGAVLPPLPHGCCCCSLEAGSLPGFWECERA